jgi:cyanate permease
MLLLGLWAVYVAFGLVVSSLSPVLTPLAEDLGLSKARLGVILGTWPAVFVFSSIPGGWFLDRVGLRWALFCGGVLVCLSGVLRGLATGGVSLFGAVAVFGLGGPLISLAAPKLVVSRFPERERAKATSLYLTAPVLGQIISVAAANSVIRPIAGGSWRSVPLTLAAVTGIICVLWLMLTGRLKSRAPVAAAPPALGLDSATRQGAATLLRNPVMRMILVMAVAIFFVNHGLNNWMPKMIEDSGVSPEAAGYLTAVSYAAGLIGPLVLTRWGAGRPLLAPVGVSLALAATIAMLTVLTGVAATPFLLLIGFLRFGLIALCMLVLMGAPGVNGANMGVASGLFFTAGEIGGFGGPFAMGGIADATGDFSASLLTLTAAMVLVAWLFLVINRRVVAGERGADPATGARRAEPPVAAV